MSKGQDHKARVWLHPSEARNPQHQPRKGLGGRKVQADRVRAQPTEPPPCSLLAHVPFGFLPSSPDGKSGKSCQWDIVPIHQITAICFSLPHSPPSLLSGLRGGGEVGLRDSQSFGGMKIRPQLPLTNIYLSAPPSLPHISVLFICPGLEAGGKAGLKSPIVVLL